MTGRTLGYRAPLLWLVLPWMAGLILGRAWSNVISPWFLAAAVLALATALWGAWKKPVLWAPCLCLGIILAGMAAYGLVRNRLPEWQHLPPREALLTLQIDRIFPSTDPARASGLAVIRKTEPHLSDLLGQKIYFSLDLHAGTTLKPIRSAKVTVIGVLSLLEEKPPSDTFDGYLANSGMNFKLSRGRILSEATPPSLYYRFCAAAGARFKTILGTGIADKRPELTALLRAMMLGETSALSENQKTLFMQSGTMHLFAISGLNIGVIALSLHVLLLPFRLPKWVRFALSSILLWLFVDITGASASAERAFVMATFFQAAFVARKPFSALSALVASAAVILLVDPLQLFGASFQMSYAIVLALLLLGLPLSERWLNKTAIFTDTPKVAWRFWQHIINYAWRGLIAGCAIGLATSLISLITSLTFFHLLTPGSFLANLLLIPIAMLITVGGFVSLLCGLVGFSAGASLCNHAAALLLLVLEWLVKLSVQLPAAFVSAQFTPAWMGDLFFVLVLASLFYGYAHNWAWKRGGWLPPFVLTGLALLLGITIG